MLFCRSVNSSPRNADRVKTRCSQVRQFGREFRFGNSIVYLQPIKGKPFEARFEEKHLRGSPEKEIVICASGFLYRDSEGRMFRDITVVHGPRKFRSSIINDAVTGNQYFLDNRGEQLNNLPLTRGNPKLGESGACGEIMAPTTYPDIEVQYPQPLVQRDIEGLLCHGSLSRYGNQVSEVWDSLELKQVILQIDQEGDEEIIFRLFDIRQVEPDPSVFMVAD